MTAPGSMECPLCLCDPVREYTEAHGRYYWMCPICELIFMNPAHRPTPTDERAQYETHQNDPGDARYRQFLSRISLPLVKHLSPGAEGLDYGAGPGPTLSVMLEEQGFRMRIFDPIFYPDASTLTRTYDFITATEAIEHFFFPRDELDRLSALLRPGGLLAVMTEMFQEGFRFTEWRYARDPTHVCFFAPATMRWIAGHYGWSMEMPRQNVVLFRSAEE
ncbi:class I SAM-dependent methyltransferase [soil metagenome]